MKGKSQGLMSKLSDVCVVVEQMQHLQRVVRKSQGSWWWSVQKLQVFKWRAPRRKLKGNTT
jgi:hypothetical protein